MEPQQQQQKTTSRSMSKIMKFLPKATSSVSFQNPPLYSPKKEKKSSDQKTHNKSNLGKGFSGPLVSLSENRRKLIKKDPTFALVFEPTSPRVSCMGQVKCKQYRKQQQAKANNLINNKPTPSKVSRTTSYTPERTHKNEKIGLENDLEEEKVVVVKSKKKLGLRSIFGSSRKSDATNNKSSNKQDLMNIPPKGPCSLSTMKRFSSGRDAFTNFDWTTQVAPLDSSHHRDYYTDDDDEKDDGEEVIKMPSSAPVIVRNKGVCDEFVRVGGGVSLEPRKEINLWKRRTMAQPQPLQLHVN